MRVKAAVARSEGAPLDLVGLDLPDPGEGELLIRMVACGVADLDLEAIEGRLGLPFPFVPGSEGAGLVEGVGPGVTGFAPGDAVLLGFAACGDCADCAAGRPLLCRRFAALNLAGTRALALAEGGVGVHGDVFGQSSFATHALCRASSTVRLGKDAPLELLACLGSEVLLGAGTVLDGFGPMADRSLLVLGANASGLAAAMVAKAQGTRLIIVADSDERRRALASDLGATVVAHPDDDLADLVRSMEANGVNFALDTKGDEGSRHSCLASLARNGCYAALRSAPDTSPAQFETPDGCRIISPMACVRPGLAASLATRDDLPFEVLIDCFDFEHVNDALDALRSRTVAKAILRFSLGTFGDLDRVISADAAADRPSSGETPLEPTSDPALVSS